VRRVSLLRLAPLGPFVFFLVRKDARLFRRTLRDRRIIR
jgi:hypothetical protein